MNISNFIFIGILILSIVLRFIGIDKPEGLWNDEYVSYMIASVPFGEGFWQAVKSQCHMPLYYLYLKLFTIISNNDIVLRLSSLICGVLSVVVMYFVGKEKNQKSAFYCMGLSAVSSFLIYYSQEVRLYSLLFLFSSLALLYLIRLQKNVNKINVAGYILSSILIMLTHTIGFVYVFFMTILLMKKLPKKINIAIILSLFVALGFLSPLVINIFTTNSFSQWWGIFSISKYAFLITDYFSPVLTNLVNAPNDFFYKFSLEFLIFAFIPAAMAVYCGCIAIAKEKFLRELFYAGLGVIFVLTIAAICGKLVFITKYSIEIYPILILIFAIGLTLQTPKTERVLVSLYLLLSLGYLFNPSSAVNLTRYEGHKNVAKIIENAQLSKGDYIILTYYPKSRFEKYVDFSDYNVLEITKGNFNEFLTPNTSYEQAYKEGKTLYKDVFLNDSPQFYNKVKTFSKDLKSGQKVLIIYLNSVSFLSPEQVRIVASDERFYKKTPLLYLVFSYIKNSLIQRSSITPRIEQKGDWVGITVNKK